MLWIAGCVWTFLGDLWVCGVEADSIDSWRDASRVVRKVIANAGRFGPCICICNRRLESFDIVSSLLRLFTFSPSYLSDCE